MDWSILRARSPDTVTTASVRAALADHRDAESAAGTSSTNADGTPESPSTDAASVADPIASRPTRVVADADVLAADALGIDAAVRALDSIWAHSWVTLVASDALIADTEAVLTTIVDAAFAADWRVLIDRWREPVGQPAGDHPALASAYRGGAMHVLSFDGDLTGSATGAALTNRFPVSVRQPAAFAAVFDPANLYETVENGPYLGTDREPRFSDR